MGNPATLTDIDGIGPATAEKLAAAGFATVADLAGADATKLGELEGMPPGTDFAAWIKAADAATAQGEDGKAAKAKKPKAKKPPKETAAQNDTFDGPVLVVTGPKKGFRRGGFRFAKEPTTIDPQDLGGDVAGFRRMLAILKEDRLSCTFRHADGSEMKPHRDAVAELEALLAAGAKPEDVGAELGELAKRIFGPA